MLLALRSLHDLWVSGTQLQSIPYSARVQHPLDGRTRIVSTPVAPDPARELAPYKVR